jgi:[ribosomal protein S18]-alanine N-acetyltransferase
MRFRVEPMGMEHIAAVGVIERRCFSQPWPPNAYRKEIQTNRMAHYFVARRADGDEDAVTARAPASAPADLNGGEGILGKLSRLFRGPHETSTIPVAGTSAATIVGYAGLWLMTDEAHITTIAVDPEYQGHGIGELLLLGLIDRAKQIGARWLTLEVRVTNTVAQTLYQKYTFKEMGVRRRYYSDNGEDALVMWTDPIESETFQNALCRNREALGRKLAAYD